MSINDLAARFGDACYGFLALNFLWGLYNVIMGFRRVRELAFGSHEDQAEFIDEIMPLLEAGKFAELEELTADDPRALPQLIELATANRQLSYDQLRQVVMEILQRDVMGDLEYRTNWIATSIKCGPLLGLFGTVLGMMAAFGRIGQARQHQVHVVGGHVVLAGGNKDLGAADAVAAVAVGRRLGAQKPEIGAGVGRVFALAESYPELKSSGNFLELQRRISALEEQIAHRREFYNDAVNINNVRMEQVPDRLLASAAGLQRRPLFEATAEERADVNVAGRLSGITA